MECRSVLTWRQARDNSGYRVLSSVVASINLAYDSHLSR